MRGDPLIKLPVPEKPNFIIMQELIEFEGNQFTDLMDSLKVKVQYNNYGKVVGDSLDILLIHQFGSLVDSTIISVKVPAIQDSIFVKIGIKNEAGNHKFNVVLDPLEKYEEISKSDNVTSAEFYVASTSIRPILNYQLGSGISGKIRFLNPSSKPNYEMINVDISEQDNFDTYNSFEVSFDTIFSELSISDYKQINRLWSRANVLGEVNYSTPFSIIPDAKKYSLRDSLGFISLNKNNLGVNRNLIQIDTSFVYFELFSAGFYDGNTVLIKKDGVNYTFDGTLRGHYITLFNDTTYEFVSSMLFDVPFGGEAVLEEYNTFLDTVSSRYLVMFSIKDDGGSNLTSELKSKIKNFGSLYIDSVKSWSSWVLVGKKNAISGTMPEAFSLRGDGPVSIDTTISFLSDSGTMLTTEIGPTGKWGEMVISQEKPSNSEITYTPVGIKNDGSLDTLSILTLVDSVADLSYIDAKIYPKMKIIADFTASDDKQSPVLKSLGVDYNDVAELAMNYQVVSVEKDTITQGEKNKLTFSIYNVGETKADSVSVKVELKKPDNTSTILNEFVTSIDSSAKPKFNFDFEIPSSYGYGNMAFSITVDEQNKITEFFKDNNYYEIPFYVKKDTSTNVNSTEITVKFDGYEIMDGDFVSNTPSMQFDINYTNSFPTDDTSAVIFTLDNQKISYSKMSIEYDTINKNISYTYTPSLEDGKHYLRVTGNNIGLTDDFGIEKLFEVSNELKAVDIYNYPNPASVVTDFTFRLTRIPESLDIKIYTIAGRLIKTFKLNSYDLKSDINKVAWDLRDQDGDEISNGVYLYKIILRDKDKVEHYTQKIAVVK